MIVVLSCNKPEYKPPGPVNPPVTVPGTETDTFETFLILQGKNYCEKNDYPIFRQAGLTFQAIFDSTCIYKNADPANQADINKLYGFSDCNTLHHANSARFGWNWMDGEIHIHAYCYADSVRAYKELGTVKLNQVVNCSIDLLPERYVFTLNGKTDTIQRHCSDTIASGVKLYPYFGGDEPAPRDIRIRIKELK